MKHEIIFTKEEIEKAISKTNSMGEAAIYLKINWRTFKKEAERHSLYDSSISYSKRKGSTKLSYRLIDILNGLHPQYPTSKLTRRLIKEGYKEYKCEGDGCIIRDTWNGKPITLELNHIDGDSSNHRLKNLELLCPNCHTQTSTYRSKKLLHKKIDVV